jgi:hypothetical protein
VGAALGVAGAVLGPAGIALALADMVFSGVSAAKTYAHIVGLEVILKELGSEAKPGTKEAIVFATMKKNKKLKRKGLGCVPVLGSLCNSVYTLGRRLTKKNRGVERRAHAKTLWNNMRKGDFCARMACQELLGKKMFEKYKGYIDGDVLLKKKMKSL